MYAAPYGMFLVDSLVVGVNHVVAAAVAAITCATGIALGGSLLVQLLGHSVEGLLDFLGGSLDGSNITALVDFLQLIHSGLDGLLLFLGDLVAQLTQRLFGLVDGMLGVVVGIDLFLAGLILSSELLSLTNSLVDILLAQVGGGGDGDLLLLAGTQVLSGDLYDAVGIDIEGNFDLGNTTGSGAMPPSWKLPRVLL